MNEWAFAVTAFFWYSVEVYAEIQAKRERELEVQIDAHALSASPVLNLARQDGIVAADRLGRLRSIADKGDSLPPQPTPSIIPFRPTSSFHNLNHDERMENVLEEQKARRRSLLLEHEEHINDTEVIEAPA